MRQKKNNDIDRRYYFRIYMILLADIVSIIVAHFMALLLRFDCRFSHISPMYLQNIRYFLPMAIITTIIVYYIFRLYHCIWRFASVTEAYRIILAYIVIGGLLFSENFIPFMNMPRSALFVGITLNILFCFGIRFSYRALRGTAFRINPKDVKALDKDNVMIIGAGNAARELLSDLKLTNHYRIRVIIDDNPTTWGRYLNGIRIGGGRNRIVDLADKYDVDRIIFAIPSASVEDKRNILNICKETGCKLQTVPGLSQIVSEEVNVTKLRDVNIEDLLERDPITVNVSEILESINDKVVMVTGGGGSIGSELCRQIALSNPKMLIIFDIYENAAYEIEQELKRKHPKLKVETLIGSVRNINRIDEVIRLYRPDIIYHAAAHKHVPLMEKSPNEAVKNNVFGTYITAITAAKYGVKRFLLISTDKAVNPTSLMGASKRICEMVVQMMAREYPRTIFSAVRFGNVLGSNGSVIPLFKQQIAEGGPVTVTDKDIVRYFMTIPEAVSLVLQASFYATGGEIFILDMGKPVRIDDMARNLIKLSGYKPDTDIKIVYTGLRPGEKLYEELRMEAEGKEKTNNNMIYIAKPIDIDDTEFKQKLSSLRDATEKAENSDIKHLVADIVKTYSPDNQAV